jgi:hypothetical protein
MATVSHLGKDTIDSLPVVAGDTVAHILTVIVTIPRSRTITNRATSHQYQATIRPVAPGSPWRIQH